jgi:hypothetical protein
MKTTDDGRVTPSPPGVAIRVVELARGKYAGFNQHHARNAGQPGGHQRSVSSVFRIQRGWDRRPSPAASATAPTWDCYLMWLESGWLESGCLESG